MGAGRNFCSGWGQAEKKGPPRAQKVAKKPQHGEKATKRPQIIVLLKYSYIFA